MGLGFTTLTSVLRCLVSIKHCFHFIYLFTYWHIGYWKKDLFTRLVLWLLMNCISWVIPFEVICLNCFWLRYCTCVRSECLYVCYFLSLYITYWVCTQFKATVIVQPAFEDYLFIYDLFNDPLNDSCYGVFNSHWHGLMYCLRGQLCKFACVKASLIIALLFSNCHDCSWIIKVVWNMHRN